MARSRQVFISYQRSDHAFARIVREHLVAADVNTWMDQFDIAVGAYWTDEIDKGLASSDIVVGILSPDAVESRNVKNEWDWAIQNDKPLLLLQYRPCVVPHRYVSINFFDATGADPSPALDALLGTLGIAPTGTDILEASAAVTPPLHRRPARRRVQRRSPHACPPNRRPGARNAGAVPERHLALDTRQIADGRRPHARGSASLRRTDTRRTRVNSRAAQNSTGTTGHQR